MAPDLREPPSLDLAPPQGLAALLCLLGAQPYVAAWLLPPDGAPPLLDEGLYVAGPKHDTSQVASMLHRHV